MNAQFCITKENIEIVEELVLLMKHEDTDTSDFRRMFSQLDVISRDFVVVTGCGQRSMYGYFAVKGVKSKNKFLPEIDYYVLQEKLSSAGLKNGVDFFLKVEDYRTFVISVLMPLFEKYNSKGNAEDEQEGQTPSSNVTDLLDAGEDEAVDGDENPVNVVDPGAKATTTTDPEPKETAPKKQRVAKIVPTQIQIGSAEKKFCIFNTVQEIPKVVLALPAQHKFDAKELAELQVPCNGTALFGIVTPNHPLFGVGLVCETHSRRKYFHIYGPQKCPEHYLPTKLPNLARLFCQGSGGRPQLEEGKRQTNAATMKRAHAKQQSAHGEVLKTCGELIEQKDELWLLLESEQHNSRLLVEECDRLRQECASLKQQFQVLYSQAEGLVHAKSALEFQLPEKDQAFANLQRQVQTL